MNLQCLCAYKSIVATKTTSSIQFFKKSSQKKKKYGNSRFLYSNHHPNIDCSSINFEYIRHKNIFRWTLQLHYRYLLFPSMTLRFLYLNLHISWCAKYWLVLPFIIHIYASYVWSEQALVDDLKLFSKLTRRAHFQLWV